MYCFDTDVLSAVLKRDPPLILVRRLARIPPEQQFTTAINLGELLYGAASRGSSRLVERIREIVPQAQRVLPFDEAAAEVYGPLRARLEAEGRRLAEPDLRIASIVLSRVLVLVTGNVRHFARVPGLKVENWLEGQARQHAGFAGQPSRHLRDPHAARRRRDGRGVPRAGHAAQPRRRDQGAAGCIRTGRASRRSSAPRTFRACRPMARESPSGRPRPTATCGCTTSSAAPRPVSRGTATITAWCGGRTARVSWRPV